MSMYRNRMPQLAVAIVLAGTFNVCSGQSKAASSPVSPSTAPPAAAQPVTLKLAIFYPQTNFRSVQTKKWAELVTQRTNGAVKFQIFYGETLVKATQTFQATAQGQIEVGLGAMPYIGGDMPLINAMNIPGWAPSLEAALAIARKTQQLFDDAFAKQNQKLIMWQHQWGTNQLWTNAKAVQTVDDVKGKLIRVSGGLQSDYFKAIGAVPTALTTAEEFSALQRGTVEGTFTSTESYKANGTYQVAKYGTLLNAVVGGTYVAMNLDAWKKLRSQTQQIIMQAAKEIEESGMKDALSAAEALNKELADKGVIWYTPPAKELARWWDKTAPLWDSYVRRADEAGRQFRAAAEAAKTTK